MTTRLAILGLAAALVTPVAVSAQQPAPQPAPAPVAQQGTTVQQGTQPQDPSSPQVQAGTVQQGDPAAVPWSGTEATPPLPSFLDTTDSRIEDDRPPPSSEQVAALREMEAEVLRFVETECHWGIVARRYAEAMQKFPRARASRRGLIAMKLASRRDR